MNSMKSVRNTPEGIQAGKDPYLDNIRSQIGDGFTAEKMRNGNKKRNEMGKDDFLKLMTAQMRNQDPIHPLKNEEMAAQLAQFSALEQMLNVNQNLEKMMQQQKPNDNVLAASLIGKNVVTESNKFLYDQGKEQTLKFDLPQDAKIASVAIVDAKGEIMRELDLGSMKKGAQAVKWDGKLKSGAEAQKGEYSFRVTATDANETPIQVKTSTAGLVTGVVFEGGKPMLIVGEAKIPFDTVNRIENPTETTKPKAAPSPMKNTAAAKEIGEDAAAKDLTKNPAENEEIADKNVKASTEENSEDNKTKNIQDDQLRSDLGDAKINEEDNSSPIGGDEGGIPISKGMDLWSPYN